MPMKNGELTSAEIRKLIKAHNILVSIKIPTGTNRDGLIKLIEKKGYSIDHKNKSLRVVSRKSQTITLKGAEALTKPKAKTELQKQKASEKKEEKAIAQKKKERELKKEAVKKATKSMVPKKPAPKKAAPKKPAPKKQPAKKEDDVRPVAKVGRPRFDPSKITVVEKKKKEKKKFPSEGAKKVGERIKAKKVKLLTSEEYFKLSRKAVNDITPTEKAQMEKYENQPAKKEDKKESPIKEKIQTPEEMFLSNVLYVISQYQKSSFESGYVDINQKKKNKTLEVLGSIIDKKKTSNFTKPEIKQLEGGLRFYRSSQSQNKKGIKNWESILKRGSEKKSKKKESPKKLQQAGHRMKGGLISMIMTAEGEAKTILENTLKKFNSLTDEEKEENRQALDNELFDKVISYEKVDSSGNITGGGVKALKEVQKKINKMGTKKDEKSPPPLRFSGSKSKIDKIKSKVKKGKISVEEGLKEWKIDIEAYERRRKVSEKSLINKGYKSGGVDELKALEKEGIEIIKN